MNWIPDDHKKERHKNMKSIKYFLPIVICMVFISPTFAQNHRPENKFPVIQLQEDFSMLRQYLEHNHPAIYRYHDKAYYDSYFDSVQALIQDTMTELEFIKILDPVAAKVHCGHTELWYSEDFRNYLYENSLFIPVSINYLGSRAYIVHKYRSDPSIVPGSEVLSINGIPVSHILKTLYSSMNGDGFNKQNILYTINHSPVSTFSKYLNYPEQYTMEVKKPGGKSVSTLSMKGMKYQKILTILEEKYPSDDTHFSYERIDSLSTAIITIRSFVMHDNDQFHEFLKSSFEEIDFLNIRNLIIDVRGNDGGHPDYAIGLLKYLMDREFVYFQTEVENDWDEPTKPHKNIFHGNVFTLIDGGCFSTSGHFISIIKYHRIGQLIGKESGSTFSCNDNSMRFVLPHTKIGGKVARNTFETAVTGFSRAKGIMPDHLVESNLEDILEGTDTIMEYTFHLIRKQMQ